METLLLVIRWTHIVAGAAGLLLFWVPIFSRKGAATHKRFGRGFLWAVYTVGISSLLSVGLHLAQVAWQGHNLLNIRQFGFLMFLVYLAINVMISAWYMRHVLIHKRDLVGLRRPLTWALAGFALLSSLALILLAMRLPSSASVVMYALSPIGLLNAWSMQRHLRFPNREPRAWFYEHMGQGIGIGIAFHTAFIVVGARTVLDQWLVGMWGVLPWVAPAVIGITANILWERYYRLRESRLRESRLREPRLNESRINESRINGSRQNESPAGTETTASGTGTAATV